MNRLLLAGLSVLAVALLAGNADARKKTYCQKAVSVRHSKVVARKNGVTVYRDGSTINACSDAKRFDAGLYIMDPGYRVARVSAAKSRCLAILFTAKGQLPKILTKDLGGKTAGSSLQTIGFGYPAARVGSLSVSTNCAAAWGESVTDGAGTKAFHVQLKAFGAATDVQSGIVNEVATVKAPDDIKHVSVKAVGRKVKVRWTQGGAPQSKTLP